MVASIITTSCSSCYHAMMRPCERLRHRDQVTIFQDMNICRWESNGLWVSLYLRKSGCSAELTKWSATWKILTTSRSRRHSKQSTTGVTIISTRTIWNDSSEAWATLLPNRILLQSSADSTWMEMPRSASRSSSTVCGLPWQTSVAKWHSSNSTSKTNQDRPPARESRKNGVWAESCQITNGKLSAK